MSKGYQVIEPEQLLGLYDIPNHQAFAVAVLHWLVRELLAELNDQLAHVELDVIGVNYLGSYPALGVHYHDPTTAPDFGPLLQSTIEAC